MNKHTHYPPVRVDSEFPLATDNNGFTLVELAIVLVIVGLLVGMGAGLMGPLTRRAKVYETKEIMNAGVESVISFSTSNDRLPNATELSSSVRNPNDIWSRPLNYIFDNNLTGGICGRKSTSITVNICPDSGCASPQIINDVAFIILSSGENANNQTAVPATSPPINVYSQDVNIDNYAGDMSRTEAYDDIVKWISLNELRIKAGCVGPQIKILNNELPVGTNGSPYSADIYADGGVPFTGGNFKWCRQEDTSSGLTFLPATLSLDCANLAESSWGAAAGTLNISGQPSMSGTVKYTFFVRDDSDSGANDNIAKKTIVLTIN